MAHKIQSKKIKKTKKTALVSSKKVQSKNEKLLPWLFLVIIVTAICFSPMLQNNFTNWDDDFYVINNTMLKGPDWKAIFTQPVVGNYHPLTIITLAVNYQLSGTDPFSYLLLNLLLHLANTALVFYFIYRISEKKLWVAFFTALVFSIHPMHVESVVWVSERKDVLYTFFFLLSLQQYWKYLEEKRKQAYALSLLFFILSLLSKPAAVILPLVLFLLDYWKGRLINIRTSFDKIPFFILGIVMGIITVVIQTGASATLDLNNYPLWTRFFFASYALMIYFFRFFIPYPLATLHPFPAPDDLGTFVLISPVFVVGLLLFLWYYRSNKLILFGFLFFIINLLLVLQIISIGSSIVSERYTYMPYIGLAFMIAMLVSNYKPQNLKQNVLILSSVCALVFSSIAFNQTKVWNNSGDLWNQVITYYPENQLARGQRANYLSKLALQPEHKHEAGALYQQALEDCRIALEMKPDYATIYQTRALIYLDLQRYKEALADADSFLKYSKEANAFYIRGSAYARLGENERALPDFNNAILLDSNHHKVYNIRAAVLMNYSKNYSQALHDLNKAILLSADASYYLNRSICYYHLNDLEKAKADARIAMDKGIQIPQNLKALLNL
jgi:tetratricopeptide (TPR) repeat protein